MTLTTRPILENEFWALRQGSGLKEYVEIVVVVAGVTLVCWTVDLNQNVVGQIYLLTVIALSTRVGRWPILTAAVVSAITWDFVFIPPKLSFSQLNLDQALTLGTYFLVALIGGQLTGRIRVQERHERRREQRSTALFHLTRALAATHTIDEVARIALHQADALFNARSALLLAAADGSLEVHPHSSLPLDENGRRIADWAHQHSDRAGRFTKNFAASGNLHLPFFREEFRFGVLVLQLPPGIMELSSSQDDLLNGFATQIGLLIEREHLRAAGERDKLFAESDRLRRTLLDSVSHELKTPLSVLRSAAERLGTEDGEKRKTLIAEIRMATRRLDHLVANLLNQTRLEAGGLKARLDWCDVRDLCTAARRAVGEALESRPFQMHIPSEFPLFLADAILMEHVLGNILLNAVLHTPDGTAIRMTAGLEPSGQRVFISIEDSGPGLAAEIQSQLFQKFQRGPGARAGGLGLGLSIVRGFTLAQGGEVAAGPSSLGGACFTISLPYVAHGIVPNDEH